MRMPRFSARMGKKRKRPRLIEPWDARRTALPRSLLTTSLRRDLHWGEWLVRATVENGKPSGAPLRTTVKCPQERSQ